jgi:TonB dependent receptor/Carboxypeptidase regulatory-like domain/TonB-dependent Receptor Plug Domain
VGGSGTRVVNRVLRLIESRNLLRAVTPAQHRDGINTPAEHEVEGMIWELCTVRVAAYMLLVVSLPIVACAVASGQETGTPQQQGTVSGRVLDKGTSDPIIEAGVEVVDLGKKTRTDLDGNFKLQLAPGTYQLRVFAPLYQGTRLQNVIVKPNQVTRTDVTLVAQGQAGVQVVEVVAQADKAAEATQLIQRKKAAVVSDTIAAETITKSPDRTAAEVVKRVPAVTIQNGKFVFVRGLGERYSSALLNGSRLPSTDPSKRVVPLDLFPAEFIESLNILKSYTPDLPGDFSGGLVDIRLREFPDRLTYTIGLTTGANSDATFQRLQTYKGSDWDYLGLGAGFRSRPADHIPDVTDLPKEYKGQLPPAQQRAFAGTFHNIWSPESMTAPPNFGVNFSIGDTIGPVGVSFGAIYNTEYRLHPNEFQQNFTHKGNPPNIIIVADEQRELLTFDRSTFLTRLGAVFAAGYKLTDNHKLSLRALVDRNSTDEVIDGTGYDRNLTDPIRQWQLQYKEEQLGYGQLAGEHHWPFLDINWRTALSQTTETEPDTRLITYDTATSLLTTSGPESSERLFSNLDEYLTDSAVHLTVPFKTALPFTDIWSGLPAKFKFGPAYAFRHRNFHYRRFVYGPNPSGSAPPEVLLAPDNIPTTLSFGENTRKSDSFTANQEIAAMYGMFDLPLIQDRLRLVAGVRVEYSYIITDGADLALGQPLHTTINDLSPLPGANLIYSVRDDMNLRYAYSRSTSRPEFRELTPTRFVVPNGERPVVGNPALTSADIEGHDLRWEWFFSPSELVSFGVFYKQLTNPIEQTVGSESAGETDSFKNAKDATLRGLEFEARKNLSIISPRLSNFSLLTNVAYIDSQANIPHNPCGVINGQPVPCEVQTSTKRALQGQAEYIVNAAVEYAHPVWGTARLFYNTLGPRIVAAGADGLPDITEHPRNQLDLVLLAPIKPFGTPLTAKLSVENLLDDPFVQTQAGYTAHRYTTGVKMGIGLSYTY